MSWCPHPKVIRKKNFPHSVGNPLSKQPKLLRGIMFTCTSLEFSSFAISWWRSPFNCSLACFFETEKANSSFLSILPIVPTGEEMTISAALLIASFSFIWTSLVWCWIGCPSEWRIPTQHPPERVGLVRKECPKGFGLQTSILKSAVPVSSHEWS